MQNLTGREVNLFCSADPPPFTEKLITDQTPWPKGSVLIDSVDLLPHGAAFQWMKVKFHDPRKGVPEELKAGAVWSEQKEHSFNAPSN